MIYKRGIKSKEHRHTFISKPIKEYINSNGHAYRHMY